MLATSNLNHKYRFERHYSFWSVDANNAANMNTASIALALRLFSASIRWQVYTTIKVGKVKQLSNIAVGSIPYSQQIPATNEPSLINSAAEGNQNRSCFGPASDCMKKSL